MVWSTSPVKSRTLCVAVCVRVFAPVCLQIDKCFGFDTAVDEAQRALLAAKVEATSGYKGLGVVKLMGRSSGFIAMQASMASGEGEVALGPCPLSSVRGQWPPVLCPLSSVPCQGGLSPVLCHAAFAPGRSSCTTQTP